MRTYEIATQVRKEVTDINTSRYWTICIIANPLDKNCNPTSGYKDKQLTLAKNFFEEEFPQLRNQTSLSKGENQYVQVSLWKTFHNQTLEREQRALAGLCLRCYVSRAIIKGCEILAKRAADKIPFENFLPYVLNDDGNTFVVVDSDSKTQLIVKDSGNLTMPKAGNFFSVEVLSSYNPNLSDNRDSESLDNWCIRRIKQNKDLRTLLLEYGVWIPSDWSLLCREVPKSLSACLKDEDSHFIEVFHSVYRRDRRKSRQRGRCSQPTDAQLKEMLSCLKDKGIIISSNMELIKKFQEIAEILRQDNHSIKTGKPQADSIDASNSSQEYNDSLSTFNQLGTENNNCEDMEENELRELLNQLPQSALYRAIFLRIPQRVEILAAKELIASVQSTSEEIFISKIQEQASQFFASQISSKPNNLKDIAQEVRSFLDTIAFKEARAEIIAARNPYKNSLFAQILRKYMNS